MNLPPGYRLDGAQASSDGGINLPPGYVLDPTGSPVAQNAPTTALGAAGRGAVSMLPLGNQAYSAIAGAVENKPYLQERQELDKETKADVANHEPARLAGQAAGLVAPALLTGGASAPESLAEAAGQGALVGGGFGVGNAIDTLASGGSGEKAAGDVALGAGLGAVTGGVANKVGGALSDVLGKGENIANEGAYKYGNWNPTETNKLRNALGPEFKGEMGSVLQNEVGGVAGKSHQDILNKLEANQGDVGSQIGAIYKVADDAKTPFNPVATKYEPDADTVTNPVVTSPDGTPMTLASGFHDAMQAKYGNSVTNAPQMNIVNQIQTDLDNLQQKPSFQQAHNLMQVYAHNGKTFALSSPESVVPFKTAYGMLRGSINNAFETNPELAKTGLADLNSRYSNLSTWQNAITRQMNTSQAQSSGGFKGRLSTLPGIVGYGVGHAAAGFPGAMIGGIAGSNMVDLPLGEVQVAAGNAMSGLSKLGVGNALPIAGAQIAGGTAQNMGENKQIHSPSSPLPKLAPPTTLNINHPALSKWKQTFTQNAASAKDTGEIQKSQAITDFKLSQTDPAYAKAKQEAIDNPMQQENANAQ